MRTETKSKGHGSSKKDKKFRSEKVQSSNIRGRR